jgi:hypothetical protein
VIFFQIDDSIAPRIYRMRITRTGKNFCVTNVSRFYSSFPTVHMKSETKQKLFYNALSWGESNFSFMLRHIDNTENDYVDTRDYCCEPTRLIETV